MEVGLKAHRSHSRVVIKTFSFSLKLSRDIQLVLQCPKHTLISLFSEDCIIQYKVALFPLT